MKLLLECGTVREQTVLGVTAGIRVRAITLEEADIKELASLHPEHLQQWVLRLSNRFPPTCIRGYKHGV